MPLAQFNIRGAHIFRGCHSFHTWEHRTRPIERTLSMFESGLIVPQSQNRETEVWEHQLKGTRVWSVVPAGSKSLKEGVHQLDRSQTAQTTQLRWSSGASQMEILRRIAEMIFYKYLTVSTAQHSKTTTQVVVEGVITKILGAEAKNADLRSTRDSEQKLWNHQSCMSIRWSSRPVCSCFMPQHGRPCSSTEPAQGFFKILYNWQLLHVE